MPKCEHGLTSKECYVCASPKHAEQAEKQEPFGYFQYAMHFDAWVQNRDSNKGVAFYTAPPQRKPLPKGEWPKHPSGYVGDVYKGYDKSDLDNYAMQVLAAHGIKE